MYRELDLSGVVQVNIVFFTANILKAVCFEPDSELALRMGIQKNRRLKADAVLTLF